MSIYFNGALITNPGAYAKVDVKGMGNVVLASPGIGAIVGIGLSGTPNIVYSFTSLEQARDVFYRSATGAGENALWTAIKAAFSPSSNPDISGPSLLKVVKVGNTTDQTHSTGLITASPAAGTLITLTSKDYGVWNNYITYKVGAGTTSGLKVTLQDPNSLEYEIYDNMADSDAIVAAINSLSQLVTAVKNAAGTPALPSTLTAMSGATGAGEDNTDWQNALDLLKGEVVNLLHVTSTDASVHTLAEAHCKEMSRLGKKNRRCVVGGAAGGSKSAEISDVLSRAGVQNSAYVMLCTPGPKLYNEAGVLTQYAPNVTAAMIFGLFCGMESATPGTFKLLNVKGLQWQYSEEEMAQLPNGYATAVQFVSNKGYRIGRSIMTTTKAQYAEMSVNRIYDYISTGLTSLLDDTVIGTGGDDTSPGQILSLVTSFLSQIWTDKKYIHAGYDNLGVYQPAYRKVNVRQDPNSGDQWLITFEVSPVEPVNYILITVSAKRTTLAATA